MIRPMALAALLGIFGSAVAHAGEFGFSFSFGRSSPDVVVVDPSPVVVYDRPSTVVVRDRCSPRVIIDRCGPEYVIYDRPVYYRSYYPRYYTVRSYGRTIYADSCGPRYSYTRIRYR